MEVNKKLVNYATHRTEEGLDAYIAVMDNIADVASMYREHFLLMPMAASEMLTYAQDINPFANSLANFLHIDKDAIEVAYSMWCCSRKGRDERYEVGSDEDQQ
ncbi:hypothetical protein HGRIS_014003 [Hohenbuehelia grisea]|uniref:Uncharacterized protein n=1 Tax=Hohenbuehelia grisea TaxID=104357 RepID=A0ABR3JSV9_9AGAR